MKELINSKTAKIGYFIIGLAIIAVIMVFAINNSNVSAYQKGPKIIFKETVHDFGKVPQGPSLQYNFKFTNKGNSTLRIERIQTTCGCTGATVGTKTEYEKNEKGEIKVEFHTQGRIGHQEKGIVVFTNDPNNMEVTLKVKCDIDPNLNY
ncbi:MAG: DUF1573 domain-containing protein [Ignavibacteria bacterium]|nr:DUF1573 domain-containing protein [Ignavibacteria bacterium]